MNQFLNNKNKGFTLIELLVSFAILTTGLAAALSLVAQSLKSSGYIKNQTIASYLAVEGIELVKNKRNQNFLETQTWLSGLDNCIAPDYCTIDPITFSILKCPIVGGSSRCDVLKYDTTLNLFNYTAGVRTIFTRKISISDIGSGNYEKEIVSEVGWNDRFGSHSQVLKTHIFDWFN